MSQFNTANVRGFSAVPCWKIWEASVSNSRRAFVQAMIFTITRPEAKPLRRRFENVSVLHIRYGDHPKRVD